MAGSMAPVINTSRVALVLSWFGHEIDEKYKFVLS